MKKKIILASSILAGAIIYELYKDASNYGREIIYRERFYENSIDRPFTSIKIKNKKGLSMQGYLLEKENVDKTLIILHPYNGSSKDMLPYVYYFEKLINDCNILLIDMIGHGNSDGYLRGLGYDDVDDIVYWNKYLLERYGDNHKLIMYGKEIGGNALLNSAGLNVLKNVQAIISEGACNNIEDYLSYQFTGNKFSLCIVSNIIKNALYKETGKDISKMNTEKLVKYNRIPTLYVHSIRDKEVLFNNVIKLYNSNGGQKQLFPIKYSNLYDINMDDDYSEVLREFIKQYIGG